MIRALYRPMTREQILLVAGTLMAATALYCIAYNLLAGEHESLGSAMLWALVNVVPWYLAFEAAKRSATRRGVALALGAGFAASLLGHMLAYGVPEAPVFEIVRRLPGGLLVLGLLATGRLVAAAKAAPVNGGGDALPLAPSQVDWVSAAGNYVELRAAGRTVLYRAPLSRVHEALEPHGFVRIHRSILVRRDRIARVRPGDVILHDGTSLRTGKRYRAALATR